MNPSAMNHLHLVGLGGSNKVMAGEFSRLLRRALSQERSRELLAREPEKVGPGGLLYPFAADAAKVAVYYHRTSARVLWSLYSSTAERLEPLYDELMKQVEHDPRDWMQSGLRFSVLAFGSFQVKAGERQIVGVVKNALIDGALKRGIELILDPEDPQVTLHVRSMETRGGPLLAVSIDLAGRPMHQRGYRLHAGDAPLREDLAAQLVMLARFDARSEILIDPLAGSGTLAIEAALMAAGKPVWMSGRAPQARELAPFSQDWSTKAPALFGDSEPMIYAAELDTETYGIMDRCLATAGTSSQTTTYLGDFRDWDLKSLIRERHSPEQRVLLLSNPPYGGRLGMERRELIRLYRDLAAYCRQFRGARAAFIIGDPDSDADEQRRGSNSIALFMDAFGQAPRIKKPMKNGPLNALFLMYDC